MKRLTTSETGLSLIKAFEGFRALAAPLDNGGWVVGYGHTASARKGIRLSHKDAADLLRWDVRRLETPLHDLVFAPMTQNQFDALISLVFNIGLDNFKTSMVLRHLNEGHPVGAADGFDAWRCAYLTGKVIVVDALVRRRAAEKALFLTPAGAAVVAPTPQVPPLCDHQMVCADDAEAPLDMGADQHGVGDLRLDMSADEIEPEPQNEALETAEETVVQSEEEAQFVPLDDIFGAAEQATEAVLESPHNESSASNPLAAAAEKIVGHLDSIAADETPVSETASPLVSAQGEKESKIRDEAVLPDQGKAGEGEDKEPPLLHSDAPTIDEDASFQPASSRGWIMFVLMGIVGIGLVLSGLWQLQKIGWTVMNTTDLVMGPGQTGLGVLLLAVSAYSLIWRLNANVTAD